LHREAIRLADFDGVSLNQYLIMAINSKIVIDDLRNYFINNIMNKISLLTLTSNTTIIVGVGEKELNKIQLLPLTKAITSNVNVNQ
jgi:flavorubredoxin